MIGKQLSHFRILDKLGEGGMGAIVLEAEDTEADVAAGEPQHVALKIFSPDRRMTYEMRRRFQRGESPEGTTSHLSRFVLPVA